MATKLLYHSMSARRR